MEEVLDTWAVVTGGSRGVGRAVSRKLLASGTNVILTATTQYAADEAASELSQEADAGRAVGVGLDLRDIEAVHTATRTITGVTEHVDALVCNASAQPVPRPLLSLTPSDFLDAYQINVIGHHALAMGLVSNRQPDRGQAIVNVVSAVAHDGASYLGAYAGAKAALLNLTKTQAKEWATLGVRVNSVTLGPIDTDLLSGLNALVSGFSEHASSSALLKRLGTTDEAASAIVFLCDPVAAAYITGADLCVAGGAIVR